MSARTARDVGSRIATRDAGEVGSNAVEDVVSRLESRSDPTLQESS